MYLNYKWSNYPTIKEYIHIIIHLIRYLDQAKMKINDHICTISLFKIVKVGGRDDKGDTKSIEIENHLT